MSTKDLTASFLEKIEEGERLITYLASCEDIKGVFKMRKRIQQEIKFLKKVLNSGQAKLEHATTSNITWYTAVIEVLKSQVDVFSVMESFMYREESEFKKLTVDIVTNCGCVWIKVVAKSCKNISSSMEGDCSYGRRNCFDQAVDLISCAEQNLQYYKQPKIVFVFTRGVSADVAESLKSLGITVKTENSLGEHFRNCYDFKTTLQGLEKLEIQTSDSVAYEPTNIPWAHMNEIQGLNLDVTTLIAYVSDLCNSEESVDFHDECIKYQLNEEMKRPLKPILDKLFEGRKLICCQSAAESFKSIVNTVGGIGEKLRAEELLKRVEVVSDNIPQELKEALCLGGSIKKRSLCIFATGYALKMLTVTANEGFYRAAKNKGINFFVFLHEPRALTEKMKSKLVPTESLNLKEQKLETGSIQ